LKFNSKFLGVLTALFVIAMAMSIACAANSIDNENFSIEVPDGSDFSQVSTSNISFGDMAIDMLAFENSGSNSADVGTIMYLKESADDLNIISDLYNDLKKDGEIAEENDKYVIFKTPNSNDFLNLDVGNSLDDIMGFAEGIFSSEDKDIGFSSNGDSISFSDKGLEISDANGQNVSISSEGIVFSDEASSDEGKVSGGANVTVDGNFNADIQSGDYAAFIKNKNNDQVLLIVGNDLDAIKGVADTASFK
jgi:hypothetical protein